MNIMKSNEGETEAILASEDHTSAVSSGPIAEEINSEDSERACSDRDEPETATKLPESVRALLDAHEEMLKRRDPTLPSWDVEQWIGEVWEQAGSFELTPKPTTHWEFVRTFGDALCDDLHLCELGFADEGEAFRCGLALGAELARHEHETRDQLKGAKDAQR
jgi:hypothetical protein